MNTMLLAAALFAVHQPSYLRGVGIDQNLGAQTPLQARFADESGRSVKLGDYLRGRPAVLALVYYTCPALCNQILHGIASGLKPLSLRAGSDFDVIAVSINPSEKPADAAAKRRDFGSPEGWHFLTGADPQIHAVADPVGFHYRYEPKTKMFFHGAGIMVLTPEGKVARYLYGVDFEPKDLKLALVEASHERIGSPVDKILLYCCKWDPTTGKYSFVVLNLLKVAALAFFLVLAAGLAILWRPDFGRRAR